VRPDEAVPRLVRELDVGLVDYRHRPLLVERVHRVARRLDERPVAVEFALAVVACLREAADPPAEDPRRVVDPDVVDGSGVHRRVDPAAVRGHEERVGGILVRGDPADRVDRLGGPVLDQNPVVIALEGGARSGVALRCRDARVVDDRGDGGGDCVVAQEEKSLLGTGHLSASFHCPDHNK